MICVNLGHKLRSGTHTELRNSEHVTELSCCDDPERRIGLPHAPRKIGDFDGRPLLRHGCAARADDGAPSCRIVDVLVERLAVPKRPDQAIVLDIVHAADADEPDANGVDRHGLELAAAFALALGSSRRSQVEPGQGRPDPGNGSGLKKMPSAWIFEIVAHCPSRGDEFLV